MSIGSELSPQDLVDSIRSLYAEVGRFDEYVADSIGIDRTALRAIDALKETELHPKDFAVKLGITTASVTAMLDRLEKGGHINRTHSPTDRRSWVISLTDKTRKEAGKRYSNLGLALEDLFADRTNEELSNTLKAIEELTMAFEVARNK